MRDTAELLTVAQAAQESGLKQRTIRGLFNTRALPLVRIGSRLYVRRGDLLAFIEAATIPAANRADA